MNNLPRPAPTRRAPRLLAPTRQAAAGSLAAIALAQALAAVVFAEAIDALLAGRQWFGLPMVLTLALLAIAGAVALLAERWIGERFAQSFVIDCRAALFGAAITVAGAIDHTKPAKRAAAKANAREARWLSGLINDLTALRNYALRGTVRLWTSALSGTAAAVWVLFANPDQRIAMLPLVLGACAIAGTLPTLADIIGQQRTARGQLNRFLIRRMRAEMTGQTSPRGHGFKRMASLSDKLGQLSVRRATIAGAMDGIAVLAGGLAAVIVVLGTLPRGAGSQIAGTLTLVAFISARLLESARALHARTGGQIALTRFTRLIGQEPTPSPTADHAAPRESRELL